jgi:hypothetical protein
LFDQRGLGGGAGSPSASSASSGSASGLLADGVLFDQSGLGMDAGGSVSMDSSTEGAATEDEPCLLVLPNMLRRNMAQYDGWRLRASFWLALPAASWATPLGTLKSAFVSPSCGIHGNSQKFEIFFSQPSSICRRAGPL